MSGPSAPPVSHTICTPTGRAWLERVSLENPVGMKTNPGPGTVARWTWLHEQQRACGIEPTFSVEDARNRFSLPEGLGEDPTFAEYLASDGAYVGHTVNGELITAIDVQEIRSRYPQAYWTALDWLHELPAEQAGAEVEALARWLFIRQADRDLVRGRLSQSPPAQVLRRMMER